MYGARFRMLESTGPTNTRKYTVAVYFRGERLEKGMGRTIQQAEMNAAANALKNKSGTTSSLGGHAGCGIEVSHSATRVRQINETTALFTDENILGIIQLTTRDA